MFILYLLLTLAALFIFFVLIQFLNGWGEGRTGHTFFTTGSVFTASAGYWLLFFGNRWHADAEQSIAAAENRCYAHASTGLVHCLERAEHAADPLNGILLMVLGLAVLGALFWYHLRQTKKDPGTGILLTLLFFVLSVPMSIGLFFIVLVVVAWFSDTKPVYTVNHFFDDD